MSEEFILELILFFVLSVISNFIVDKFMNWIRKRRERRRLQNPPIDDNRPFHVNTGIATGNAVPPLPVRQSQSDSLPNQQPSSSSAQLQVVTGGHNSPPVLPQRRINIDRRPEDFPRCPIHKCCNRRGQEQKIF